MFIDRDGCVCRVLPSGCKVRYEAVSRPLWAVVRPCQHDVQYIKKRALRRLKKASCCLSSSGLHPGLLRTINNVLSDAALFNELFDGIHTDGCRFQSNVQFSTDRYPLCSRNEGVVAHVSMLSSFACTEFWKTVMYPIGLKSDGIAKMEDYETEWKSLDVVRSLSIEKRRACDGSEARVGYYSETYQPGETGVMYLLLDDTHAMYLYDF